MTSESKPTHPAEMYQAYFVPAMFTPWARILLDHAKPQSGEHILDVACGTGVVTRMVASMVGVRGRVVGLDYNVGMLAVARGLLVDANSAPIEWREESALAMTLPDAAVDLVVCQQGLQFFPDRAAGVREMRRVLKPGGRAVVAVWQSLEHNPASAGFMHAEARRLNAPLNQFNVPFSLGDADELRALFAAAGFQRVDVQAHAMTVRFPQPERFVQLNIASAAAAVPALREMDPAMRAKLADDIAHELRDEMAKYIDGDMFASPMAANIVVAR